MKKFIRKLQRVSSHSIIVTLPKTMIREFGWRERQKVEIVWDGKKPELLIRDWKKR